VSKPLQSKKHLRKYEINESTINILRQSLDEFKNVRLTASIFDLFLGDLFFRFDGTEQDVEPNSAGIKSRLLRNQCQVLAVLLDIQLIDPFTIQLEEKRFSESNTSC
jgi:hypothetical protein